MPTLYALEVLRAERKRSGTSTSAPQADNLYVRVKLGKDQQPKTKLQDGAAPTWNETLFLSPDNDPTDETLLFELKQRLYLGRSRRLGFIEENLEDLKSKSVNGDAVPLSLNRTQEADPLTGSDVLYVRLSATDAEGKRNIQISLAIKGAKQSGIGEPSADTFEAFDKGFSVAGSWADIAKSLEKILEGVDSFVAIFDEFSKVHPLLSLAWHAVSCVYKVARKQQETDQWFAHLVHMMEFIFGIICSSEFDREKVKTLEETICQFMQQSVECCVFIQHYISHGFIGRTLDQTSLQKINDFTARFRDFRNALNLGIALQTSFVVSRVEEKIDIVSEKIDTMSKKVDTLSKKVDFEHLRDMLKPPVMDASSRQQCLSKTRTELLEKIMDWIFSDTDDNILWLRGVAGSGKSTISTTISVRCDEMRRCGAYLLFEREKSEPYSVIRALAFSLAMFDPTLVQHISNAVNANGGIAEKPLVLQFTRLIYEPLRKAAASIPGPVIIILDALDECGTSETREALLSLIENEFSRLPRSFRFLITSRPEKDISRKLTSRAVRMRTIDLDISSKSSREDVSFYIQSEMRRALEEEDVKSIPDWDQKMDVLSRAANGLFIWASTASKMIAASDNASVDLEKLVSYCQPTNAGSHLEVEFGLESLYRSALCSSGIQWKKDESRSRFTQVLGLILLSKMPLSVDAIVGVLGFEETSSTRFIVDHLQSVLVYTSGSRNVPVRICHTSFSDYLTDPKHSKDPWYIDVAVQRHFIAMQCFKVMQEGLRFNICDIDSSYLRNEDVPDIKRRVKEKIPPALEYACCSWAAHLCDVPYSSASCELIGNLMTFAQQSLLYWIEVLSLTQRFRNVYSHALTDASSWSTAGSLFDLRLLPLIFQQGNLSSVSSLLLDAHQFAAAFATPISASVPHIYLSALSFAEDGSKVREHYSTRYPAVRRHTCGSRPSQSHMKVLEGHTDTVMSVAVSPDGKRIVSGSRDNTILVWDAGNGAIVAGPFVGHTRRVTSVAFSADGKRVVSGSDDKTIRVWDAERGALVVSLFEGNTDSVISVAFSIDGKRVVSCSRDKTIRVWNAENGVLVAGPYVGDTAYVESVASLGCGKRVVSGLWDKTIRVLDAESGELVVGPFEGHTDYVLALAISADGRRIVSGSLDRTIRVWDADSGSLVAGPLKGHSHHVTSVAISSDGKRVASGSRDGTIRVWDARSGALVAGPFEGHTDDVKSVAISADGKRIVSCSYDGTTRLWNVEIGALKASPLDGHTHHVTSVAFSPDGKRVVSSSGDKTIRVWHAESGALVAGPFVGHTGYVRSVAFSADGKRVVSGSFDKTIRVWDAGNGAIVAGPFVGHTAYVRSVAFSADGKRVVSGAEDKTIRVWDAESGALVAGPFTGHTDKVKSVAFSPDGKRIVSGSDDKTICVWDAESGALIVGPFTGHSHCVTSVAISADGTRIVSGSFDKTIRVWNAESGSLVAGPLTGHTDYVKSVGFSPDGRRVVSGSDDKTICVWDAKSGALVAGPFVGHMHYVTSVVFSIDGKRVISGSWDKTIRMWDVNYDCEASCWMPSQDGWVLGRSGDLLLWVPADVRPTLLQPSNIAIFSCQFSTRLDFTDCKLGPGWHEGFPRACHNLMSRSFKFRLFIFLFVLFAFLVMYALVYKSTRNEK